MRLRKNISMADTDYGAVLLDEEINEYYQLNRTGADALGVLLAGGSDEDAVRRLISCYDIDEAQAHDDVVALRNALSSQGLVTG